MTMNTAPAFPDLNHPLDEHPDYLSDRRDLAVDRDMAVDEEVFGRRFTIADDEQAAWAMRKLRSARAKQAEFERIANDEIARIRDWLATSTESLSRDVNYFEGLLIHYAAHCRDNPVDGRKTISLPAGKVASRNASPKWEVDAEPFLQWARDNAPSLIRVKEEPSLTEIKNRLNDADGKAIDDNGEVVPGITIRPATVTFTVTPDLS